ncbi:BMP family protein [Pararhodobacter marinus]|uniref:BMP family protein n=1 Tax=Pararhodobacter marinus TaxID=2184063 RepID=UPI0035185CBE
MKIAVVFVGELHDQGFNASGLEGALRARDLPGVEIEIVNDLPYDEAAIEQALFAVAARAEGCVIVGGQGNRVTHAVAAACPRTAFAVVQGEVTGPNLASYDVLQEESAFLAGVLAARMTRSGIVGHLSGHRVTPGLKGRAAFVSGAAQADPSVRVLTGFCGTQDDSAVTRAWTEALAGEGVDILFTMLNAARGGAIAACRSAGIRQIGNVIDWCAVDPAVFIGSAMAGIDRGVERAIRDMLAGVSPDTVVPLGLATSDAIKLSMAPDVPATVMDEIAAMAGALSQGRILPATIYSGPEMERA